MVDDSSLMRKLITKIVEENSRLKVVDTALNGIFALKKIEKHHPDVVLLDIEMPEMDGIEFLEKCRDLNIDIPIIVLSSLGKNRPEITLKCLALGAKDFIIKPSGTISMDIELVKDELLPKIIYYHNERPKTTIQKDQLQETIEKYTHRESHKRQSAISPADTEQEEIKKIPITVSEKIKTIPRLELLTIGISTGGPHALRKIMPLFPPDFPLPILIVQHMPPGFTDEFAKGLDEICQLTVKEAEEGEKAQSGVIYIARGDRHLQINREAEKNVIHLSDSPPENGHRPSVEVLFDSATASCGNRLISVIMTGMGKDGARAIKRVRLKGGITIAQSENTCVVFGMPKVAIEMEGIDEILDLDNIVPRVLEITNILFNGK